MTTRLKLKLPSGRMLSFGLFLAVGILLVVGGCTKEEAPGTDGSPLAVTFTAGIEQAATSLPQTRTTVGGDSWASDDAVGIFMLTTGGTLMGDVVSGADNVRYTVMNTSTGALSGAPIYYPQSGNVDFVAYYPHGTASSEATGAGTVNSTTCTYNISVAGQSTAEKQAAIDVMYAKTTNVAKSATTPVPLTFGHVMSKITFNVTHGEGVTADDISGMAASDVAFGAMPTTATMALQDGTLTAGADLTQPFSPLKAATAPMTCDATFTAILVPQPASHGLTGRTVVFTLTGIGDLTWEIPDEEVFEAGKHYIYPVTVRRKEVTVGEPSIQWWYKSQHYGTGTVTEVPIETVYIKAGTFIMGSPEGEVGQLSDEIQHEVTLTKDFYMSKYEITNAQYAAFLNASGIGSDGKFTFTDNYNGNSYIDVTLIQSHDSGVQYGNGAWTASQGKDNFPVVYVTWYGALAYAQWMGGTLPTDAQWEYACRAGTTTAYSFWDHSGTGVDENLDSYAWYDGPSHKKYTTDEVGLKKPNPWGLYDMHGNVREWCYDSRKTGSDYSSDAVTDPISSYPDGYCVLRGGGWYDDAPDCRSARRFSFLPGIVDDSFGFRIAVVL